MSLAAIIAARDEASTVAANVRAALGCAYTDEVLLVDDGSGDATAWRAEEAGARVISLDASVGSKAHAMRAGVAATDADLLLFLDADCTGLTAEHLDSICEPVVSGRAELSLGAFDYGPLLNPLVLRLPPLTGQRVMPRWVFEAVPEEKIEGYTIELRLNEVVSEGRHRVVARTLPGLFHRTKRVKFGRVEGIKRTAGMCRELLGMMRPFGDLRWRLYLWYRECLTVER